MRSKQQQSNQLFAAPRFHGLFAALGVLAAVVVPLLGQQDVLTVALTTATVAALSAGLAMLVTRPSARPASIRLANRDYPGPERFRVADDPRLSGRPQPRAPNGSCAA